MSNNRKYTILTQEQLDDCTDEELATLLGNQSKANASWFGNGQAPYLFKWEGNKPTFFYGSKSGEQLTHSQIKAKSQDPEDELYRPE